MFLTEKPIRKNEQDLYSLFSLKKFVKNQIHSFWIFCWIWWVLCENVRELKDPYLDGRNFVLRFFWTWMDMKWKTENSAKTLIRTFCEGIWANRCSTNLLENHSSKNCNYTLTSTTKNLDCKKHLSTMQNPDIVSQIIGYNNL